MSTHRAAIALLAVLASAALVSPVAADSWQRVENRGWYRPVQNRAQYDRGYRDGYRDGEQDENESSHGLRLIGLIRPMGQMQLRQH